MRYTSTDDQGRPWLHTDLVDVPLWEIEHEGYDHDGEGGLVFNGLVGTYGCSLARGVARLPELIAQRPTLAEILQRHQDLWIASLERAIEDAEYWLAEREET